MPKSSSSYDNVELGSYYSNGNGPYIAAEFSEAQFEENKNFTLGDGRSYSKVVSSRRKKRSTAEYVNGELDPNYKYSVFYRAVLTNVSFAGPSTDCSYLQRLDIVHTHTLFFYSL